MRKVGREHVQGQFPVLVGPPRRSATRAQHGLDKVGTVPIRLAHEVERRIALDVCAQRRALVRPCHAVHCLHCGRPVAAELLYVRASVCICCM